jgi:uncharacterized membrane protein YhaH (DUF805 family)
MNNMGDVIRDSFSKYTQFEGRMTKRNYWQWWLFTLLTYISAGSFPKQLTGIHSCHSHSLYSFNYDPGSPSA